MATEIISTTNWRDSILRLKEHSKENPLNHEHSSEPTVACKIVSCCYGIKLNDKFLYVLHNYQFLFSL